MVKLSIVQGRLASRVGGRYQHFPIHAWRNEFGVAAELGLDGIEWIVSDFSNPLLDDRTVAEVAELGQKHGVSVTSMSLDVLMYHPVFRLPWDDVAWLAERLGRAAARLGVPRISIPIEENSGLRNPDDKADAQRALSRVLSLWDGIVAAPCIETDLSPRNAEALLGAPGLEALGLVVDLGNIAALGYRWEEYRSRFSERIFGLHVKDRTGGMGPTVPLGQGDAEIPAALEACGGLPGLRDVTLQAFRSPDGYVEDAAAALAHVRRLLDAPPA